MQWMERKRLLGSGYQYDKWMSEDEVARWKRKRLRILPTVPPPR